MGFDLDNSQFYPPFSALDRFLTGQTHFQEFQAQSNTSNDQKESGLSEFSSPYYGVVADQHQYVYGSPNSWLLPDLQGEYEPYSTTFCYDHSFHEGAIISNNNDTHGMISQGNNNSHDCPENGPGSDEKTSRRARKGSSSTLVKRKWTEEEDRTLAKMVEDYGMKKWACIANKLDGRSAKQCRERWQNHLRPDIKKDSWTEEEEKIFVEVHKKLGNRWSEIAKRIPGRTENAVKNHWNAAKRRRRQETTLRKKKVSQNLPKPFSLLQDYIERNNYGCSRGTITHNNKTIIPSTTISEVSTLTPPRPLEPLEYEHSNLPLINENNCDDVKSRWAIHDVGGSHVGSCAYAR